MRSRWLGGCAEPASRCSQVRAASRVDGGRPALQPGGGLTPVSPLGNAAQTSAVGSIEAERGADSDEGSYVKCKALRS
jgi:hypothetical protein